MYFSKEQIEQSVKRLKELNPFFGTVFLAFKGAEVPINATREIQFSQLITEFLQNYYSLRNDFSGFYIPYKLRKNEKHWITEPQCINYLRQLTEDRFKGVLYQPEKDQWEWMPNYVATLKEKYLAGKQLPTFDLAVWLFRTRQWNNDIQGDDVIKALFTEFHITEEELQLFQTSPAALARPWLEENAITNGTLLDIIEPLASEEGAALKLLTLRGVGPAEAISCKPAPRLNLITGDNGLGKTFLLECAWWTLTGTWAGAYPAYPRQDIAKDSPRIEFQIGKKSQQDRVQSARYNWGSQEWLTPTKRNLLPGLSIFSQADDAFAVWDPVKYQPLDLENKSNSDSDALIRFSRTQVWDGIEEEQGGKKRVICNGLLRDWITWQTLEIERFKEFCEALKILSPHPIEELLIPGQPTRMPNDARLIPTLKFPYGEVPIVLCSAGVQRIVALAYLLVWAWNEHVATSRLIRKAPQRSIVLLIDEVEAHLHPFWQRTIVPALIKVVQALSHEVQTQVLIVTHSPLILASIESIFDSAKDKLFHLYLENHSVKLDEVPFTKRGRVDRWLISEIFGLDHPRSQEAEEAIEQAKALQRQRTPSKEEVQKISDRLVNILAQDDDFWPRWTYFAEQRGI